VSRFHLPEEESPTEAQAREPAATGTPRPAATLPGPARPALAD
jgi:hypothetical protein